MWSAGSSVQLRLGSREWHLRRPDGAVQSLDFADWAQGLEALRSTAPASRRWWPHALDVVTSLGVIRPFVLDGAADITRRRDAMAVANALASEATGLDAPCRVLLHDWRAGQPTLATAMPATLVADLHAWAAQAGLRLRSIQPWWVHDINALSRQRPLPLAAALHDDDGLVVLADMRERTPSLLGYWPAPCEEDRLGILERAALAQGCSVNELPCMRWQAAPDAAVETTAHGQGTVQAETAA